MRKCTRCKITIDNNLECCPLCSNRTQITDDRFEEDYPYIKSKFNITFFLKIISFLAISFAGVSFIINFLIPFDSPWTFIVAAAIVYLWISVFNLVTSAKNLGFMILTQLLSISGLLFVIDIMSGYKKWSTNYVIPFMIIAAAMLISIIIIIRPMKFREYSIYQLVIAILGALSLLMLLFKLSDVKWPLISASFYSIMSFVGMLVFSDRKTKNELKKRFHL